jgi:hypothetical protein
MRGVRLIRIIHGWGSSGSGGHIRDAVRKVLAGYVRARRVRRFVSGEEYSEDTASGRELMAAHAALRQSLRTDRDNPGITFVEM